MRITAEHDVIEIGHILWGAWMAPTRLATVALPDNVDANGRERSSLAARS